MTDGRRHRPWRTSSSSAVSGPGRELRQPPPVRRTKTPRTKRPSGAVDTVSSGGADDRAADEDGAGRGRRAGVIGSAGTDGCTAVALSEPGARRRRRPRTGLRPSVHPRLWQRRLAVLERRRAQRLRWIVAGVVVRGGRCLRGPAGAAHAAPGRCATPPCRVPRTPEPARCSRPPGSLDSPPLIDVDPKTAPPSVERAALGGARRGGAALARQRDRHRHRTGPAGRDRPPRRGRRPGRRPGRVLAWQAGPRHRGSCSWRPVTRVAPGPSSPRAARPALAGGGAVAERRSSAAWCTVSAPTHRGMVTLDLGGGVSAVLGYDAAHCRPSSSSLASVLRGRPRDGRRTVIDVTVPDEPAVGPATTSRSATVTKMPVTWVWAPRRDRQLCLTGSRCRRIVRSPRQAPERPE